MHVLSAAEIYNMNDDPLKPADLLPQGEPERVPAMQRMLDNPFLLLFLGITVPTVFYIIWGIMEIVSIPITR
jgi:hypothetical protein